MPPAAGPDVKGTLVITGVPLNDAESTAPPGLATASVASQPTPAGIENVSADEET